MSFFHLICRKAFVLAAILSFVSCPAWNLSPVQAQQNGSTTEGQTEGQLPEILIRATDLPGQSVLNSDGRPLAKIDDLMIDENGQVYQVILSIDGFMNIGEKLVAVKPDELTFQTRWNYRSIRKADGTEEEIPWDFRWEVFYEGNIEGLRDRPDYAYPEKLSRGDPEGYGVYSYPPGPQNLKASPVPGTDSDIP